MNSDLNVWDCGPLKNGIIVLTYLSLQDVYRIDADSIQSILYHQ